MQEEGMEKTKTSSAVSTAKPAGGDQRRVDTQTRYSQYGRKRDYVSHQQTDVHRHNGRRNSPRNKELANRSRPGGARETQHYASAESQKVKEAESSQFGARKGNLNHLLNFTFNSRDKDGGKVGRKRRVSYKLYNKEQFLQANCQFVVCESGDYQIHATDPDKLVDWNLIEQVRVFEHGEVQCPICLYPPTAAKITRCGHVYCWSCMLHYLSLDDSSWSKCPICYEAVHRRDLKSVRVMSTHAYQAGETMTLRLMKKARGSTVIQTATREELSLKPGQLMDMETAEPESCYSKLLIASAEMVTQKITDVERRQLESLKSEHEPDSLEASFIDMALAELSQRQERLMIGATYSSRSDKPGYETLYENAAPVLTAQDCPSPAPRTSDGKKHIVYACAFSDLEADPSLPQSEDPIQPQSNDPIQPAPEENAAEADVSPRSGDDLSPSPTDDGFVRGAAAELLSLLPSPGASAEVPSGATASSPTARNKEYYYFYQADDGQQIYLHSVNARCLMAEYGGLDKCPPTITGRVEALECVTMTEELRRRLRYLNHLPLTCQFRFVQLQLKTPLLSQRTLDQFEGEFAELRRQRHRKQREERRLARRQDRQDSLKTQLDTYKNTTIIQSAAYQPELAPPTPGSTNDAPDVGEELCSGGIPEVEPQDGPSVPSFASMLRQPTSGPAPVWPRVASSRPAAADTKAKTTEKSDSDEESYVPRYQDAFSDAIQTALDSMSIDSAATPAASGETNTNNHDNVKKGKKKKKLLFTTTMNRAL